MTVTIRGNITINSVDLPQPDALHTLITPSAIGGDTQTFLAPAGVTLNPEWEYWVSVAFNHSDSGDFKLEGTVSNNEDSGAATGWSMGDHAAKGLGATATQILHNNQTVALQMSILGNAIPASNDATLSNLTLKDASTGDAVSLDQTFDPDTMTGYTATVGSAVSRVTVKATPTDSNATGVDYLDGNGDALTDADSASGFQVDLATGDNVIRAKVTAEDGSSTETYEVTVTREVDTTGPVLQSAVVNAAGTEITLTFNETLNPSAGLPLYQQYVSVTADGATVTFGSRATSGATSTLTSLSAVISQGQEVVIAYTDPTTGDDQFVPFQDNAGNDAVSFTTGQDTVPAVDNQSTAADSTGPVLQSAVVNAAGTEITLTFNETLDPSAGLPLYQQYVSVTADGATVTFGSRATSGATSTLTSLSAVISQGQEVVIAYTDPTTGDDQFVPFQDNAGNDAVSFTTGQDTVPAVDNQSTAADSTGPVLQSAVVNAAGTEITLTFNETLDPSAGLPLYQQYVSVTADGATVTFGNRATSGATSTLTSLSSVIGQGQEVVVAYTDQSTGDDQFVPFQDNAGNDAASFTTGVDGVPAVDNHSTIANPSISEITVSDPGTDGYFSTGDTITVSVTFNQNVTLTGGLTLKFEVGDGTKTLTGPTGSGTKTLAFTYTVLSGDVDIDGVSVPENALTLASGATLQAGANRDADLSHAAKTFSDRAVNPPVPAITKIEVASTVPSAGFYFQTSGSAGQIDFDVTFSAPVIISGVPALTVRVGSQNVEAFQVGLDTGKTIRFRYFVLGTHRDTDGVSVRQGTVSLGANITIKDRFGRNAVLTHGAYGPFTDHKVRPTPDAPGNLRAHAGDTEVALSWDRAVDHGVAVEWYQYRHKTTGGYGGWQVIGDSAPGEANETGYTVTGLTNDVAHTFQVLAKNAAGFSDASGEATVTPATGIRVSFASATGSAPEAGGTVTVEVRLAEAPTTDPVTVPLTATPGETLGTDGYTGVPQSVTFAVADDSESFTVTFRNDDMDEPDATLTLGFGELPEEPVRYIAGTPAQMVLTALDDDYPHATVSLQAARAAAPEGTEFQVTVRLSEAPQRAVTVPLSVTRGSGLQADEYAGVPQSVSFAAAETEQSFTVSFVDDTNVESDETLTLGFGTLPDRITAAGTLELTVEDDDGPPGAVRNLAATAGDGFVALTWNAPPQNDSPVLRYEVSVDGGTWQDVGLATTHREEDLTNGTEYAFRVRAANRHGEGEAAEKRAIPTERITALPEAAQILSARTDDASRVRLGWVRPSNAADWHPDRTDLSDTFSEIRGYWIQVCAGNCDAETSWADVTTNTGSTATEYVEEGLSGSIRGRSYRVRAVNINGRTGPWSNVATLQPVQVSDLYPRARPDHQTVEVRFRVAHPDGAPAYLRLKKTGGDRAATDAVPVALNRAAGVDDYMAVWFHGLEADTGYEVQLDFVDSFDSARRQTAFVRTLREGHPDPYQVPPGPVPETPLIEADRSAMSLALGERKENGYRIRLVAGACAQYSWGRRLVQMHRPNGYVNRGRFDADPLDDLEGEPGGYVLLQCGTAGSPGPWRRVNVEARPPHRYPVGYFGTNRREVLLSAPFHEQVVHSVHHINVGSVQDWYEDCSSGTCVERPGASHGGTHWQVAARQAPVTVVVTPDEQASKAAANVRSVTQGCGAGQACLGWDAVDGATGYQVQWRFLNQGWGGRDRQALVDGASHDIDAAATAEVRMRVRAYSTASLPASGGTPAVHPWVGPWREVTREPLSQPTGLPVIRIGDASAKESGDGTTVTMTFPVTLDRRVDGEVTVDWETVDGTALAGEDYGAASGTVTFGADETRKTIAVTILDDDLPDTGETFTVLLSDPAGPGDGAVLGNARATGRIRNHESDLILTGLTLVDAADQSVLAALADGATVTLDDPDGGSFAVRADAESDAPIGSVRLELSGAKTASRTVNEAPWSLYGDDEGTLVGEALPAGSYTLRATAYAEADLGGNVLHTLAISFAVEGPVEETAALLSATFPASPFASRSHSGPTDRPQVVVAFSEPVASFAADTASVSVSGASVHGVQALVEDGLENAVVIFLTPAGNGSIGFRLLADVACAGGGICTADGRGLAQVPETHTIPGQEAENTPAAGSPAISGTAWVGQTLAADTSGITDEDGLTNVSYGYQWIRSDGGTDTDIDGETASTYTVSDEDVGKTIMVRVSFTDDADNQETLTSAATAAVEARPNSPATGAPTISGTAQVGETLTADTAGIDDTDGLAGVSYSYQWIRSDGGTDTDIDGETASTYTVSDEDVGKTIMVRVSFTDEAGHAESLVSQATSAVAAAPSPLTASIHDEPQSHDGENVFTFELRFSEELKPGFSFKTLRDHAFTVTGGDITRAKRVDGSGNLRWTIHVQPGGNGSVTVVLPVTTDCEAEHAICTEDGRPLSNRLELTVSGPDG